MTYKGQTSDYQTDKNNALLFDVASRDGKEKFTARLPFALRAVEGGDKKLFGHPAIVHHAGGDLYLALKDGPDQFYPRGRFVEIGQARRRPRSSARTRSTSTSSSATRRRRRWRMSGQMPDVLPVWADLRVTYHGQDRSPQAAVDHATAISPARRESPKSPCPAAG